MIAVCREQLAVLREGDERAVLHSNRGARDERRLRIATCLLALLATALVGAIQLLEPFDAQAAKSLKLSDGTEIKHEGTCSFNDRHISCWDAAGMADGSLSDKIEAIYSKPNAGELALSLHKKNRLLIFSRSKGSGGLSITTLDRRLFPVVELPPDNTGSTWTLAFVKTFREASTISLFVSPFSVSEGDAVRTRYFDGARLVYDGATIEFGGARPLPEAEQDRASANHEGYFSSFEPGKHWSYFVEVRRPETSPVRLVSRSVLTYSAYDRTGNLIKFVDRNGNPISETQYAKENDVSRYALLPDASAGRQMKYSMANLLSSGQNGSISILTGNVNPSQVGYIQVSGSHEFRILFKDIVLDPKQ